MKKQPTIGVKLALLEDRLNQEELDAQRQARLQRLRSFLMIILAVLLIGIGLGYAWRMQQELSQAIASNYSRFTFERPAARFLK